MLATRRRAAAKRSSLVLVPASSLTDKVQVSGLCRDGADAPTYNNTIPNSNRWKFETRSKPNNTLTAPKEIRLGRRISESVVAFRVLGLGVDLPVL